MCTGEMKTADQLDSRELRGRRCPLCTDGVVLDFMRFLDPHGRERLDSEVFECSSQRHTFLWNGSRLRLLAEDGKRPPSPVLLELV
jgi:hypothetical protein